MCDTVWIRVNQAPMNLRSRGVAAITTDSESVNPSSNLGGSFLIALFFILLLVFVCACSHTFMDSAARQ